MNGASVDDGAVADGHIVADPCGAGPARDVHHRTILHVAAISEADPVYIAAKHGLIPDAALRAHRYIPNDIRRGRHETVRAHVRRSAKEGSKHT